jgi:3-phenylpropionate/trans-cinnamate dioxygenase ferredoxin reductase subunit
MAQPSSIVIVGASLAGLRAASALRRAGYAGRLTLIGGEPHLPYDRPPLSKQLLLGTWEPGRIALTNAEQLADAKVETRLGVRATALDTRARVVKLADGSEVAFDALLIATGAAARPLPGTPPLQGVHLLRTIEDSLAIRAQFDAGARVAVVGMGFIGAEVAAAASQRGLQVTVVEVFSQPLERALGPVVGAICGDIHRDHGVDLRLSSGVAAIEGEGGHVKRLRLQDGSTVEADCVVVGIGVVPETGWLEGSGLTLRDGVVCEPTLNVGVPGIFAAGDVCRWYNSKFEEEMRVEHWTNAVEQGMHAARNMLRDEAELQPFAPVPYVWSDQYDLSIQVVGRPHATDAVHVKHGALADRRFVALYARNGRLTGAVGFGMPRELGDYRRLLNQGATLEEAMAHVVEVED